MFYRVDVDYFREANEHQCCELSHPFENAADAVKKFSEVIKNEKSLDFPELAPKVELWEKDENGWRIVANN